ncbi:MAG: WGR domain-containing protein [Polyangiales bacterium]
MSHPFTRGHTMRRFEFVEGSSSKFWEAEVQGTTFTVVYGRIGTPGVRKDKPFATPAEAQREHDKKVAEKLREGYAEVGATSSPAPAAQPAPAAPAAPKPAPLPPLAPRFRARSATAGAVAAATDALAQLEAELGGRSWKVARLAHRARRALDAIAGIDPGTSVTLTQQLDAVLDTVTAGRGARRLPLHHALDLLLALDARAFDRALSRWRAGASDGPATPAVRAVGAWRDALGDAELGLRVASLVAFRDVSRASDGGWTSRHRALAPHLTAALAARGAAAPAGIDPGHDDALRRALARVAA